MNELITNLWIGAQIRMKKFRESLVSEERGAAEIVAIILIIVVIIAVAVIFRTEIVKMVNKVFGQADSFVNDTVSGS